MKTYYISPYFKAHPVVFIFEANSHLGTSYYLNYKRIGFKNAWKLNEVQNKGYRRVTRRELEKLWPALKKGFNKKDITLKAWNVTAKRRNQSLKVTHKRVNGVSGI